MPLKPWDEYWHLATVLAILIAQRRGQITLFQLQRDQDVAGCCQREEQMPRRHRGRGPKRDNEAQHERVPHDSV